MSEGLNNQYTPAPLDIRALRRGGEDIVALCDEVERLRARVAELEATPWPVGSLQWAMDGERMFRRPRWIRRLCALSFIGDDCAVLRFEDLIALDWEIYEEGGNGSV